MKITIELGPESMAILQDLKRELGLLRALVGAIRIDNPVIYPPSVTDGVPGVERIE